MNSDWKPSLFLVDDEPDQVFLVELAAERSAQFSQVRTAIDSQLAYQQLLECARHPDRRPDVIVIDWKMPRMHGGELAAALMGHPELAEIPVVALSTSGNETDRRRALESGCRAFYQKPTSFERLVEVFREIRQQYCDNGAAV